MCRSLLFAEFFGNLTIRLKAVLCHFCLVFTRLSDGTNLCLILDRQRNQKREELVKGSRFHSESDKEKDVSLDSDYDDEMNKFIATSADEIQSPSFQDTQIRLACKGDCGSRINEMLISNTNLQIYKRSSLLSPRSEEVKRGKADKIFYTFVGWDVDESKLQENAEKEARVENEFVELVVERMKSEATCLMGSRARAVDINTIKYSCAHFLIFCPFDTKKV